MRRHTYMRTRSFQSVMHYSYNPPDEAKFVDIFILKGNRIDGERIVLTDECQEKGKLEMVRGLSVKEYEKGVIRVLEMCHSCSLANV